MRYIAPVLVLACLIAIIVNAGRVGGHWGRAVFPSTKPILWVLAYTILTVVILGFTVICRIPNLGFGRPLVKAAYIGLAAFLIYIVLANVAALLLWLGRLVHLIDRPQPAALSGATLITILVLIVGLTTYGTVHSAAIQDRAYDLTITAPGSTADTLDIALISDTHLGFIDDTAFLGRVVDRVNALQPDVVLIAGDVFDGDFGAVADPEGIQALFASLTAPDGVYACLGNHDAGSGAAQMVDLLEAAGVHVLRDEVAQVGDRFVVAGRRDSSPIGRTDDSRRQDLPAWTAEQRDLPVIVLDHQPSNIGEYDDAVDLILSGHTHNGQIFPGNLIVKAIFDVAYGHYRASDTSPDVIVTSGVGTWGPPLRIASDSEVVHIHVTIDH
jgi:predicted MPP superfamily phosphohydrolase